jgi:hypothetical protein
MRAYMIQFCLITLVCCFGGFIGSDVCSAGTDAKLATYAGGFFSISKPEGWNVITAGNCASFAFVIRDPQNGLRQIFHFGEVGPVYLSEQQRAIDYQYMNMGGYPMAWIDMPAVDPLTPSNFLQHFQDIAQTRIAQEFMPQLPRLSRLQVISTTRCQAPIPGATTELLRGLFVEGKSLAEGLFVVTVAPMLPYNGGPGGGLAYAFLFSGITAPKDEFAALEPVLTTSLASYKISESYVSDCMRQQATTYEGILRAGRTLAEASDVITDGWEARNRVNDILSEKTSDAILGRERLYNPDTGEVFEFENGFYDHYDISREKYRVTNLQRLPEDAYDLWMAPALDGARLLQQ